MESGNALVVMPDCRMAKRYLELARRSLRQNRMLEAMRYWIEGYMLRFGDVYSSDPLWTDFLRHQLLSYLLRKSQRGCSLAEGDMIHDYIRESYVDLRESLRRSEIPFKGDVRRWFDSQRLDFPFLEIDIEAF